MYEIPRIPILKIEDYLVASIQVALHDRSAVQFKDDILHRIYETKAKGLILDLTAVDVVDSFIGKLIGEIGDMAGLMGAKVVITGLQPAVAITLIELGLELEGIITALNLEKGIEALRRAEDEAGEGDLEPLLFEMERGSDGE
jgi:rsbT antagonist protein RsbS